MATVLESDFGNLREQRRHLLRRTQVIGRVLIAHAVGVAEQRTGLYGEQHVLVFRIRLLDVVHVVGGNEFRRVARAKFHQPFVEVHQFTDVVLLQFDVKAVRPKDIVIPIHAADGFLRILVNKQAGDLGRHAARGADKAFGVRRQKIMVDAWVVVEPIQLCRRGDLQQVVVAGLVLGK